MFDLKLTERGDIMLLESQSSANKIKIDFMLSKSKPIRIDFYLDNFIEQDGSGAKLQFEINGKNEKYHCNTVQGTAAAEQACLMRLRTELGDMKHNETIGSKLETIRHKPLHDTTVQTGLQSIAKEAIADILPNARVTVVPLIEKNNNRYDQVAKISVYDEDLIIAEYKARG